MAAGYLVEALSGQSWEEFVHEFLEMELVVSLKEEHTLSMFVAGQPDYELEPYQGTEFLVKGSSGISVEFQRDASGTVTGVAATLAEGVFHASKKG
jgi:CubicO group peptidase (beta-lactamase class C family)